MVLNATDTFEYESSKTGKQKMFHATGATLDNLYHMKVFNIDLKEKFTKNKFLLISNYIKNIEFLIIDKDSSVFKVTPDEKIEIPNSLTKNVRETPQISAIQEKTVGKLISGLFVLHKVMCENLFFNFSPPTPGIKYVNFFHLLLNDNIATKHSTLAGDKI